MSNYEQLVEALRHTDFGDTCDHCERWGMCKDDDCIILQAAAAIEALQKDLATLQKCYEIADTTADEVLKKLPKRGEWIVTTETSDDGAVSQHINCSVCGFYWREPKHRKVFKRCPNCGAKMEVQE